MACSSHHPALAGAPPEEGKNRPHPCRREKGKAPQWMLSEVAGGLQRLILLALPGTPAAEMIEGTARAWTDAFWHAPKAWDQDLDAPRIAAAFQVIGHRLDSFPSPKAILESMPPRPPQPALPEPEISEEQRRRNLMRVAQIMTDALNKGKGLPPKPKHQDSGAVSITPEEEEALLAEARERYKDVPQPQELA